MFYLKYFHLHGHVFGIYTWSWMLHLTSTWSHLHALLQKLTYISKFIFLCKLCIWIYICLLFDKMDYVMNVVQEEKLRRVGSYIILTFYPSLFNKEQHDARSSCCQVSWGIIWLTLHAAKDDDSKCSDSCHHTNQQEGDLLTIEVELTQIGSYQNTKWGWGRTYSNRNWGKISSHIGSPPMVCSAIHQICILGSGVIWRLSIDLLTFWWLTIYIIVIPSVYMLHQTHRRYHSKLHKFLQKHWSKYASTISDSISWPHLQPLT